VVSNLLRPDELESYLGFPRGPFTPGIRHPEAGHELRWRPGGNREEKSLGSTPDTQREVIKHREPKPLLSLSPGDVPSLRDVGVDGANGLSYKPVSNPAQRIHLTRGAGHGFRLILRLPKEE
jgi:hypothetical protein